MGKRFVFVEEVQDAISKGETEMELPEGTRFSPAAADLVREKDIRVLFTGSLAPDDTKSQESAGGKNNVEAPETAQASALIAVVSAGKTASDTVGNVAARSPYFLIFNGQGELIEVLENPHRDTGGGAGPLVAEFLAGRGITTMVAGSFGSNMKASLDEKGINYFECSGKAEEAARAVSLQNNGAA